MIRAVIFDLDGTLVDHLGAQAAAFHAGLRRLDLLASSAPVRDEHLLLWRQLERHHMDAFLAGECSFDEQRRRRLRAFLPTLGASVLDDAEATTWWQAYNADYEASWAAYDDVTPCLTNLHGLRDRPRLGVLTNGDSRQQRAKIARFGWTPLFDELFVSSEIGAAKPDPVSYLHACRHLEVAPEATLFVGDVVELDALAPTAAGLHGVWLDRTNSLDRPPCPRITSLTEIAAFLPG